MAVQIGDVSADDKRAAKTTRVLFSRPRPVFLGSQGGRRVGTGQLEQLVGDVRVVGLGHLQVPLVSGHNRDRHLGQVAQDNGAVVGGGEVCILSGLLVGRRDR